MVIIGLFILHWYASLFFQSFFNHRYAAHQMFRMSKGWEKAFFIGSWLTNGSSYLSAYVYGALHRMHHAFADTPLDPHSPKYDKNIFAMMLRTRKEYLDIEDKRKPIDPKFLKNLPNWPKFDFFASHLATRIGFGLVYVAVYLLLATAWWQWLFLPMTLVMGPLHGAVINWFAHKVGYTNFELEDTSKNFLPVDFLMWGESYHNNHHKHGSKPNFGHKWWEIDPMWPIILFLDWTHVIRLKVRPTRSKLSVRFSQKERSRIIKGLVSLPHLQNAPKIMPERKLKQLVDAWQSFVQTDWKGNLNDYVSKIHVRQELQVFLENANGSVKKKIASMVEPLDRAFKAKMKPVNPNFLRAGWALKGKHFWETHSIFQGELA
jgi:stearoyl-CoA desaturase (Delta-9 desaturase)